MALTPEQKKRVQERATELIAKGIPTVEAVDKAFTEVAGSQAFPQTLAEKGTTSQVAPALVAAREPFASYEDLPRQVAKREIEAKTDIAQAEKGLAQSKAIITSEKARQIAGSGLPGVLAEEQASRAFEKQFNTPMGRVYGGGVDERRAGKLPFTLGLVGIPEAGLPLQLEKTEPSIIDALRTRSYIPQEVLSEEKKKQLLAGQPTWGDVYNQIRDENPNMTSDELNNELWALKSAYDAARVDPKNVGKSTGDVFETVIGDLRQINYKIGNKSTWRKDPEVPQEQKGLMSIAIYAAFQKQTKASEGFPDLSPVQIAYLTTQRNKKIEKRYAELQSEYANKDIIDTEEMPGGGGTTKVVQKKLEGGEKLARLRQMAENEVAIPFWADAEKLQSKLSKAPTFALLSQESPYGTTRETNLGWLLRSAMVVPNVAAGVVFPAIFTGHGQTRQDILAERKSRRPEAYKEHPVLLNVAEGRGFVGEAGETADIMGLGETNVIPTPLGDITLPVGNVGQLYTAGAFAADLLDPSLDVIAGGAKGGRVALQTLAATKAAGLTPKIGAALGRGAAEAGREIIKSAGILSAPTEALSATEKALLKSNKIDTLLEAGDLRHFIAGKVEGEVAVANEVKKAIDAGGDVNVVIAKYPKSEFSKQWSKAAGASPVEKFDNIRKDAKYLGTAIEDGTKFDNFVAGASGAQTTPKVVLEGLAEVAASDKTVADKVAKTLEPKKVVDAAGVESLTRPGTNDLLKLVREDADVASAIRGRLVNKGILSEVYKNTREFNAFDNYLRVTKNTWATPEETDRLMRNFKSTDFGKAVDGMNSLKVEYGRGAQSRFGGALKETLAPGASPLEAQRAIEGQLVKGVSDIVPGSSLTNEQKIVFQNEIKKQKLAGKIPPQWMPFEAGSNFISFKDTRKLIDNSIDLAAAGSKGAVAAPAVKKLAPRQSFEVTIPVEARSFSHAQYKDILDKISSVTGVNKPANLKLSAGQRAAISETTNKLSKVDVQLRNEMTKMMRDPAWRKAITGSEDAITRSAALAYMTFPAESNLSSIEKVLKDTANSMLTSADYKEDAFNVFSGLSLNRTTDIWSSAGRAEFDKIVGNLALEIKNGEITGDNIWTAMRQMHDELATLASRPGMVKNPDAKIIDLVKNSGSEVVPPEVLVSAYYRSVADRAIDEVLRETIESEGLAINRQSFSKEANTKLQAQADRMSIKNAGKTDAAVAKKTTATDKQIEKLNQAFAKKEEALKKQEEALIALRNEAANDPELADRLTKEEARYVKAENKLAESRAKLAESVNKKGEKLASDTEKLRSKNVKKAAEVYEEDVISDLIASRMKTLNDNPDVLTSGSIDDKTLKLFGIDDDYPVLKAGDAEAGEILSVIDETAKKIFDVNNLKYVENPEAKINRIRKSMNKPDVYEQMKIIFGNDVAAQMKAAFGDSGAGTIQSSVSEALAKYGDETGKEKAIRVANNALGALTDLFYTAVLTAAPRFHAGNIIGAPSLIYSTTGKLPEPVSLLQALAVTNRAGTSYGDISKIPGGFITDAAGRKYTPNELWEAFSTRAGQSTNQLGLTSVAQAETLRQLGTIGSGGKTIKGVQVGDVGDIGRSVDIVRRSPGTEDTIWRMTVGIQALKEGRTLDEATALARAALYDAGDITSTEKKLQKATLFYSFSRNNLVNLVKNMTDPGFWKRIVKAGAFKRGATDIALDWNQSPEDKMTYEQMKEMKAFAPTSTDTRVILGFAKPVDGKPVYIGTVPDSTLSALDLFGNILAGGGGDVLAAMLRPETKALLNLDETHDMTEIPAEHIWWLQQISDSTGGKLSMDDLISALVTPVSKLSAGELDIVKPIKNDDGTYKYELTDPVQQKTYTDRVALLNYLGLMRIVGDIPNSLAAPGTKVNKADVDALLYAVNLETPLKGQSPMMQRAKNLILADKEAASWARDLSNKAIEDVKTALPATPVQQKEMDIKLKKTEALATKKAERTLDGVKAEMLALKAELNGLVKRVRDGEITKEQALARREQIKSQFDQLKVEKAALEAAGK